MHATALSRARARSGYHRTPSIVNTIAIGHYEQAMLLLWFLAAAMSGVGVVGGGGGSMAEEEEV